MDDALREAQSYELVEAADGCPSQEDMEWQDELVSIDEEIAQPDPVPLQDEALDELSRIKRSYDWIEHERANLKEYFRRRMNLLDNRERALDFRKRQVAYNLTTHLLSVQGGKRRSVDTPHGRVGFRRKAAHLKVVDDGQVIIATKEGRLPAACVKVTNSVVRSEVDKLYQSTGEVPPGCMIEPERDEFYIQ